MKNELKKLYNWVKRNKFEVEDEWNNEKYKVVNADVLIKKIEKLLEEV